ncbi:hypothetical protein TTHERM_00490970 (macronuclear) [Tetrahymena thermophila SB210]|uniref:Transmembrane protein n=1 Tax=Tetrahymena thermophila (strain SB210) TaxID=312017 RepID=Q23J75_TETTS|nr:hypothetical protein TTHERM_00490970 [Tetrahymena thermophila SB210]EAR96629.1 hypothetical protein TTHERM_00490970 [Tetrahymena thermophila SB210]|eukprot:XP_001016874.1 hypothetical protein TTHERM_00490970 [Tetrahymena thermophila SB210]
MSQKLIALTLLILAFNSINCATTVDNINISKHSYFYLTQDELESQLETDSNTYNCPAISQYFETMAYNASLIQNYTLQSHNYVHITFDVVFLNIEQILGGVTKYGQVDVNGNINTFSTKVVNDNYQCMERAAGSTKVDGKKSVSLVLSHSGNLNLTFSSSNLGTVARLGISNIQVDTYLCGQNAELNTISLICKCKSGYTIKLTPHGSRGNVYYEKQCL